MLPKLPAPPAIEDPALARRRSFRRVFPIAGPFVLSLLGFAALMLSAKSGRELPAPTPVVSSIAAPVPVVSSIPVASATLAALASAVPLPPAPAASASTNASRMPGTDPKLTPAPSMFDTMK